MDVSDGTLNIYSVLLMICGVVMLAVACLPLKQSTASRVIGGLVGLAFLGYGIYLKFIFDSGTVWIFYYVFVLPFIYIARVVKAYATRRNQTAFVQPGYPPAGYQQPGYGQPGYGQGALPPAPPAQPGPSPYGPPPTGTTPQGGGFAPPPPPA